MVPNGWISTKLNAISSLVTKGATPTTYGYDFVSQNINAVRFIGAYNCTYEGKFKSNSGKWISKEADLMLKRSKLKNGDSIICIVGNTIGSSFLVEDHILPANINQNVALIRPILEMVDPIYLQTWVTSPYIQWQVKVEASTQAQPSLSLQQVGNFKINIPPLLEQKKISKILSTWDQAISATEKLLENSQQQKKALMQQLLTGKKRLLDENGVKFSNEWATKNLESLVYRPLCYGVLKPGEDVLDGHPLIRIQDIDDRGFIDIRKVIRITDELHYEFRRTILNTNDLIISIVGTLGKVFVIPKELNGANITRAFAVIGADCKLIDTRFIYQYLNSSMIQEWLLNTATGNAQKVLNIAALKELQIPLPIIEEQRRIAEVLFVADQEIETIQKKLDCLKQEKKALMQQLLTGKKRVKVAA